MAGTYFVSVVYLDDKKELFDAEHEEVSDFRVMDDKIVVKLINGNEIWEKVIPFSNIKYYETNVMKHFGESESWRQ